MPLVQLLEWPVFLQKVIFSTELWQQSINCILASICFGDNPWDLIFWYKCKMEDIGCVVIPGVCIINLSVYSNLDVVFFCVTDLHSQDKICSSYFTIGIDTL